MSLEYQIGDTLYRIAVSDGDDGQHQVELSRPEAEDEAPQQLNARVVPIEANTFLCVVHGQHYLAHVAQGSDAVYVSIGGETYEIVPPDVLERQRRRGGGVDTQNQVTPPMPGQVITILVEVGDTVDKGQAVVVIGAMKMETSLTAPYAGVVTAINTSVGTQVNPGDILVDIEAVEETS